jgi:5-methylcytosine-specific restriction endonuclease McrA
MMSSIERLSEPSSLSTFQSMFLYHGVLGLRQVASVNGGDPAPPQFSELDRLRITPLVFGLMPEAALLLARLGERVKPAIAAHLENLGIDPEETLLHILKQIATQWARSSRVEARYQPRRKRSIGDLRAAGRPYARMLEEQGFRCAVCGIRLQDVELEHLDHILPWRLVGDPSDGSNWQVLCDRCNIGKSAFVSTLQIPAAWNWIYSQRDLRQTEDFHLNTRYVVLAQQARCEVCEQGPTEDSLGVEKRFDSGLAVADNLRVVCSAHLS